MCDVAPHPSPPGMTSPTGRGNKDDRAVVIGPLSRVRESNCVERQAVTCSVSFQALLSRAIALRMISNLRMQAVKAAFLALPALISRS